MSLSARGRPRFLGFDLGTSSLKAGLADEAGRMVATLAEPLATTTPHPGWSEQDPGDWLLALERALTRFHAAHGLDSVESIGLTGQMHATIALGARDEPLRPAMLWNDSRAAAEASAFRLLPPERIARLGVAPSPGFPAAKLAWLQSHETAILPATRYLPGAKDYLLLHLTGSRATDPSEAAGTWLFDNAGLAWDETVLGHLGLERSLLPTVLPSASQGGGLRASLAERFGLRPGIPVTAGAGDTPSVALGLGATLPGSGFVQLGTSAQLLVVTERHRPAIRPLLHAFAHAVPGRWYAMAAMLNGAGAFSRIAALMGTDAASLATEAATAPDRPTGLLFLPYLAGERTPHDDPFARGVMFGIGADTTRAELGRAVLEGLAFSLADAGQAMAEAGIGLPPSLGFAGGGARSPLLGRLVASVLGCTLLRLEGDEIGALAGALRLARLARGEDPGAVLASPRVVGHVEPDPALASAYAPRLEAFRALYRSIRPRFADPGPVAELA